MNDYIVRATAAEDAVRAFAITSKEMVETARSAHNSSPIVTAAMGRLMSAAAMMGLTLKGDKDLLTLEIMGAGPMGGVTVTADSEGYVKAYPKVSDVILPPKNGKLDVGGAIMPGLIRVTKDMGLKEPYSGTVELQTGEIAEDLTYYFAVSEQVPSSVGLGVLMNKDNTVKVAGGFIVQVMPFAPDDVITRLEENLTNIPPVTTMLDEGMTPEQMLEKVFEGFDIQINDKVPTGFRCNCSRERVEKSLISLGEKELTSLIEENETIEVKCQFCQTKYNFTVEDLAALKKSAKRA